MSSYSFHNDIFSIIILIGIIHGLALAGFFLLRPNKQKPTILYLGLILFLFALLNFDFWASYSFLTVRVPFLLDISVPFTFLMGPLFFHYIYYSLKNANQRYLAIHYVPFVLVLLYSLFFILQPDDFKYNVYVSSRGYDLPLKAVVTKFSCDPLHIRNWLGWMLATQLSAYLLAGYWFFMKHIRRNQLHLFKTSQPTIMWLRNMLMATTVIIVIAIIILIFFPGGSVEYLLAISFTLFIYYVSYHLLRRSAFFELTLYPEKYVKSSLTTDLKSHYREKLETFVDREKPYLNNLFSIKKLSEQTNIPLNHLSQIINEEFQTTFFEYTRRLRIAEAQKLLSDPSLSNTNIEEIAYKVGYNSKSAFNKAFLEITAQTPLQFRKKNKK